ncbi:FAD/NAD(P)-binding protein [Bacillus sp. DJP31]|uniref:FAD/NAD(P)-binding protein n=1 Tax=Bacillus sp. DJP31 TaxID=3409789 RepID=UPI003BB68CB2
MFNWVIIGAGIQGITVASYLLGSKKVQADQLLIIDPHDEPLANWKHCTNKIAMPFLRSPFIHHIDIEPFSLQRYARNRKSEETAFYGRYKRPSLEIFNDHCSSIIHSYGLMDSWHKGYVTKLSKEEAHWKIEVNHSDYIHGANVILALGLNEQPRWPEWAYELKEKAHPHIFHIFDGRLGSLHDLEPPVTIVGGGITAAHTALHLADIFPGKVTLVKRHPFKVHAFDSDPGWLGPKYMNDFKSTNDFGQRRQMIVGARNKGSIPRELCVKLVRASRTNKLKILDEDITKTEFNSISSDITISFKDSDETLKMKTIILTTGFEQSLPGKALLEPLIAEHQLQCSMCGYPIVDQNLKWSENLYVAGALAELEIGPTARNISGARKAAEAIVSSL